MPTPWPSVMRDKVEIGFAIRDHRWQSSTTEAAALMVNVVGLRRECDRPRYIVEGPTGQAEVKEAA